MATQELRKRANWQTISGTKALNAEKLFQTSLQTALDSVFPKQFLVDRHPREFDDIYSTYPLPIEVLDKIYNVDVNEKKANGKPKYKWGISMDFAIRNLLNGKILFGEIPHHSLHKRLFHVKQKDNRANTTLRLRSFRLDLPLHKHLPRQNLLRPAIY